MSTSGDEEWANLPAVPLFAGSAEFAPDGGGLVASAGDASATVWNPGTGSKLATLGADGASAERIDVSSDGELVATISSDGSADVWDAVTGNEVFSVRPGAEVSDLAWSPDGHVLVSAGGDGAC